jgi:hypothetical protein
MGRKRKYSPVTQAWRARNGKVVTYQKNDEKPDLPEPTNTSGMQQRAYTGRKHVVDVGREKRGRKRT